MQRTKKTLERGYGGLPRCPEPIPVDTQDLLDLMDDAASIAGTAEGATAPAYDHGMRIWNFYFHILVPRDFAQMVPLRFPFDRGEIPTPTLETVAGTEYCRYHTLHDKPLYPTRKATLGTVRNNGDVCRPLKILWFFVSEDGRFPAAENTFGQIDLPA